MKKFLIGVHILRILQSCNIKSIVKEKNFFINIIINIKFYYFLINILFFNYS